MTFDLSQPAVPSIEGSTCTDCGQCAEICPSETLAMVDGKLRVGAGSWRRSILREGSR